MVSTDGSGETRLAQRLILSLVVEFCSLRAATQRGELNVGDSVIGHRIANHPRGFQNTG